MKKRVFLYSALFILGCFVGISAMLVEFALAGIMQHIGIILAILIILWYEICMCKKRNSGKTYEMLKQYTKEKDTKGTAKLLILADGDFFQGQGIGNIFGKRFVRISTRWIEHIHEYPEHVEYIKCVICHELYHVKLETPFFRGLFKSLIYETFSKGKARDRYYVLSWKEELDADRYGCQIYGNKELFIEKMKFMKERTAYSHNQKKRTAHPSWDIRIKYISNNIEPTLERVTKEFNEYYGLI